MAGEIFSHAMGKRQAVFSCGYLGFTWVTEEESIAQMPHISGALTESKARALKYLLSRGFTQQLAAALVGVNVGRANDVSSGRRYGHVKEATKEEATEMIEKTMKRYQLFI